jgi:hypothetical protein
MAIIQHSDNKLRKNKMVKYRVCNVFENNKRYFISFEILDLLINNIELI